MIKQAKVYFDEIINQFIDCSRKLKLKAFIFTLFVTLICVLPIILVAVNYFMQYLSVKLFFIIGVLVCGILLNLVIAFANSFYYIALNTLINEEKLNFKKIFIANICDAFAIICVGIMMAFAIIIAFCLLF